MEEKMSLKELFQMIKKRIVLIVIITLLAGIISGLLSYLVITPVYQASAQLLINKSKDVQTAYNLSEVQTNLQLINTYNVIIKSPVILEKVSNQLGKDLSVKELNEKITVRSEKDSQIVNLYVEDYDPKVAAKIANTTAEVFQNEIVKIMNVDNVTILAKAPITKEQFPIKPKPLLNIAISLVLGLMTGVGLSILLEYLNNTIKNEQDIIKRMGLPVLGCISNFDKSSKKKEKRRQVKQNSKIRGETVGS